MYETVRDPSLPHQVVISAPAPQAHIVVSCNCRLIRRGPKKSGISYEPMAEVGDYADTVRVYNDPNNHVEAIGAFGTEWAGLRVPFGEEWMLRGLSGQGIQQGTA